MAGQQPNGIAHKDRRKLEASSLQSSKDSNSASSNQRQPTHNDIPINMEPEYHTEESSPSPSESDQEQASDSEVITKPPKDSTSNDPPFLPAELLRKLYNRAYSPSHEPSIPWNQMTRAQKRQERQRSRKIKAREWAWKQPGSVLRARRKAREMRRARAGMGKGKGVREKKVEVSGRQKLVEDRRRSAEQNAGALMRVTKTGKKWKGNG